MAARSRPALFAFLFYCAVTIAISWPLVTDPATLTIPNFDVYGNA
jgi:hypothetical protein